MINESIFGSIVENLVKARDKEGAPLSMDSVIVSTRSSRFEHQFRSDVGTADLRSVSKPILCLALGAAIDRGLKIDGERLTATTPVWDFFEPRVKIEKRKNRERLKKLRVEHLLNSTIGHNEGIMFRKDIGDRDERTLLSYVLNCELTHDPGNFFVYSNAGAFLISVLLQWGTNATAAEYARDHIFAPLGIRDFAWKNFDIYTAGCTGLRVSNADLNKLARLIADDGSAAGQQVVSKAWVQDMKTVRVSSPTMFDPKRALPKHSYGRYLWKTPTNHSYCDGTDGQYLIVLADGETTITTLGKQPDMKPITECFRPLL